MSHRLALACFLWAGMISVSLAQVDGTTPEWIWTSGSPTAIGMKKTFTASGVLQSARLKFAADFCRATVQINGQPILTVAPYCQTQDIDVTQWMRRGENVLSIGATPVEGPPAVALSLDLLDKDKQRTTIVTDATWSPHSSGKPDEKSKVVTLGKVRPELWGIGRRPATISPLENYEQWQLSKTETGAKQPKLWSVPGFEISLVRNAQPDEGSWIAMAFDPEGRITISREDRGLLRMTLDDERRSVTKVEPIDVDLKECRGLLYTGGWLYANANNSLRTYRLRLTDDGQLSQLERLREFPGKTGHGRNDLALGPDGRLYSIMGDAVTQPEPPFIDRTSPLRESRKLAQRKEGFLMRADLDGNNWELLCTGLRNPYGIAFHPNGDLFTYDADNEFDMGTPWYRPTRIVQLVSGADYGYREAGGQWPPNFPDHPDNGLPVIDIGRGSPTAVMFGTQLKYPTPYREALYILDWAYGRVVAVHLAPRGAGYRAATELFLQGQPLNVTDIAAGPDGAMYLTTGGRKTQSALYRVAYTGKIDSAPEEGLHEQQAASFAAKQRELRKQLESFHGRIDPQAVAKAWPHLMSDDPIVRHAARIAIEQQPVDSWRKQVLSLGVVYDGPEFNLNSLFADWLIIARTRDVEAVKDLLDRMLQLVPTKYSEASIPLLYLYRQCLEMAPEAVENRRPKLISILMKWWPDTSKQGLQVGPLGTSIQFRRNLAILLGDLRASASVEPITKTLLASEVQEDKLAGLLALRNKRLGWTLEQRKAYFTTLNEANHFVGGQGMPTFIDRLRTEAIASLSEVERNALADVLKPPAVQDEPLPPPRSVVQKWTLNDLAKLYDDGSSRGDARRGEVVFREALCGRCHRSGLRGPAIGPDLTFVARRFSRRDMLESVLAPSLAVAENYRNVQILTESGLVHIGRMVDEGDFRSQTLKLNTDALRPSKIVEIDKREIAESRVVETSPMPQGLLDSFTPEQINDLLAFLEAGAVTVASDPGR